MKLFGYDINLKAAISKDKNSMGKIKDTVPAFYDQNPFVLMRSNIPALLNAYKSWVYVCANKNSIAFAQQKLKMYVAKNSPNEKLLIKTKSISRDTENYITSNAGVMGLSCVRKAMGIEEVTEHPFHEMMKRINAFMNRFEFMEIVDLHQELCGNAYVYVVNNQLGVPFELWIIQPDRMTIVPSKEKWIAGYIYRGLDGTEVPFTTDEIIHFKFPNPKDQYYGWSPLQAMADSYNVNMSYSKYEMELMNNQAIPPIALVAPKDTNYQESDFRRILTRWNKTYGGASNTGKTAWLEGGFDIKTLNVSPKEMAYLSGRKWTREEIAAGYGVPISKLTSENVNRANAESGDYQYLMDTISPRLKRFEEKLNEKLIPLFDERLFVMFDDPVPENKEYKLKERESNINTKITSINEEREILGLEKVVWGEFPIVQQGSVPYKGESTAAPAPGDQPPMEEPPVGGEKKPRKFDFSDEDQKKKDEEQRLADEKKNKEEKKAKFLQEVIADAIVDEITRSRGRV